MLVENQPFNGGFVKMNQIWFKSNPGQRKSQTWGQRGFLKTFLALDKPISYCILENIEMDNANYN
jgi:hypothetical protein